VRLHFIRGAAVGYLAIPCGLALAQSPDPSIGVQTPVVITGTRLPDVTESTASNVTVITREEIEARHPSSAVELFRALPGVVIEQAGGRGSVTSVFTRGAKPNFTVVLIDGVRVNDQTNTRGGSFDFSTLSLDAIDHIEIVRGPESAVYGSDAVGGVINIITRKGSDRPAAEIEAAAGQFGFWRTAAQARGPLQGIGLAGGVSHTDNGSPVEGSVFRGTSLNASADGELPRSVHFELTGRYGINHLESFPDSSGGPLLAVIRDVDRRDIEEAVVGARLDQQIESRWSQSLQYGLYNRVSDTTSPGVAPSEQDPAGIPVNADNIHYRRQELTWAQELIPDSRARLALGVGGETERGVDHGSLQYGELVAPTSYVLERTIWFGFAEARYELPPGFQLSAAGRYDHPTESASRLSPKVGVAYPIEAEGLTLQLSWGRGFKLPSFYALGNPIVGNPDLKAEKSTLIEGGLTQELKVLPGELKLSWFDTVYSDLIDFNPGPVPRLVNLSQVHARGGEGSLTVHLGPRLSFAPYVSYTATRTDSGDPLRDVPRWLAGGNLLWRPIEPLVANIGVSHVGTYVDNSVPTGDVQLPSHQRVDLSVEWQVRKTGKVYVAVENLLDARYQEAVGFPAPGLVARAGLLVEL
jgi:vitamin B12 transporter